MLAVIRLMRGFLNKEEATAYRYNRSHPHFKWFLTLDAALSVALVLGGYAVSSQASQSLRTVELSHSGVVALSAPEFINHIKGDEDAVYWLGPVLGDRYSINQVWDDAETIVTYLGKGSDINDLNQPRLRIDTYETSTSGDSAAHSKSWTDVTKKVTARGVVFEIDKNSMEEERVLLKGTTNMVFIHYPKAQTLQSMMENADALKLVS